MISFSYDGASAYVIRRDGVSVGSVWRDARNCWFAQVLRANGRRGGSATACTRQGAVDAALRAAGVKDIAPSCARRVGPRRKRLRIGDASRTRK